MIIILNKIGRVQDGARGYQVGSARANRDGNATWGAEWVPRVTLAREAPNGKEMEKEWNCLGRGPTPGPKPTNIHMRIPVRFLSCSHSHFHPQIHSPGLGCGRHIDKNRGEGLLRYAPGSSRAVGIGESIAGAHAVRGGRLNVTSGCPEGERECSRGGTTEKWGQVRLFGHGGTESVY